MGKRIFLVSALFTVLFAGGTAFAQSATSTLSITSNPVSGAVVPGTGVSLGTITLTSPGGSYTVNQIPSNLALGGGALAGNLSNCALYNPNSASSTAALGPSPSIVTGSNAFSLSPALTVTSGSPVTLQIRCDVSASTPSSGTFQFTTSSTSTVGTQTTGASLSAEAEFVKQVPAGLNNAIIGIITLDATHSNQPVTLTSVPISVSAANGATLNALTSCNLTSSSGMALTTGGNAVAAITGSNTFMLDTPMVIQPGSGAIIVLRCNVSPATPVGSTLTVGFAPTSFQATASGSPVTVMQGLMANGQAGTNSGIVTVAPPGSTPSGTGTGTPANPGVPNTGEGGNAPLTLAILIVSLAVMLVGTRVAMRTR